jgi:hypothetical protein
MKEMTGLKCPGCGSQRAIHYLLNFDILSAIKENAILVISIPYILTGVAFDSVKKSNENILKWRKILFGQKAIFVILSIIIAFWILRNITYCQQNYISNNSFIDDSSILSHSSSNLGMARFILTV